MLALSFLVGIWLSTKRAKNRGLEPNVITDVGFYVILSAIVGARLYYVFLHFDEFQNNLLSIFNPFQEGGVGIGGLVMYGGFLGAILAGFIYFKTRKLPFRPYADAIAPSVGIGIFLTRIGCFLNGCCYGGPTSAFFGVIFPPHSPAGHYQRHVHVEGIEHLTTTHASTPAIYPSQLFESIGGLAIALIVMWVGRKKFFAGLEFYLVGLLYSVLRFAVDFSRYYAPGEKLGPLSHNQVLCIGLFIVFGGLILRGFLLQKEGGDIPAADKSAPADSDSQPQTQSGNMTPAENNA